MDISVTPSTLFIISTSGSATALVRHNKALQNFDADIVYFTFARSISAEQYSGLFKSPIVRGGAVTGQGLKTGILPYIDHLDPLAKKLGSVNTVLNISGELHGYNTDAFGFKTAITKHLKNSPQLIKSAVIYGNGGVSGVAVRVLQEMGMTVGMAGRNSRHVAKKMDELSLKATEEPYDLVVNATPISSEPIEKAEGLLPLLKTAKLVFDHSMPEMEGKTNYLQEYCKKNRLNFISGYEMYTPQMSKQWKLFLDGIEAKTGGRLSVTETDIKHAWKLD